MHTPLSFWLLRIAPLIILPVAILLMLSWAARRLKPGNALPGARIRLISLGLFAWGLVIFLVDLAATKYEWVKLLSFWLLQVALPLVLLVFALFMLPSAVQRLKSRKAVAGSRPYRFVVVYSLIALSMLIDLVIALRKL